MGSIIELAKKWLLIRMPDATFEENNYNYINILPRQTSVGLVVFFYWNNTWEDLPYFLTVPMVQSLLSGKNPKNIKNEYRNVKNT